MTTDRELLELAAKAARYQYAKHGGYIVVDGIPGNWNPLTDDGDALRLAVKLRLVIHVWDDGETVSAAKTLPDGEDPPDCSRDAWHSADAHACGGAESATRRAIVHAAAAIGEAMK